MTSRLGARLMFLGLLGATACGGGDDLLLGHAELTDDGGGEPMEEDAGATPAPAPDASSYRTCQGDLAGWPKVESFVRDIPDITCATPPCEFQPEQFEVAGDGSVWIAGSLLSGKNWQRDELWLGHYSATGELLGSARAKSYGSAALMTVDDQDRAWLLAGDSVRGPTSVLYRFDENVRELSKQTLLAPHTDLIPYPQHGVLLSAPGRAVEAIDYDGRSLWNASDGQRPGKLAVDDMGRIALATHETFDGEDSNEWMRVEWFAEGGSLLSGSTPIQIEIPEDQRSGDLSLVARDELTLMYVVVPRPGGTPTWRIERRDAHSAVKWRWELSGAPEPGIAIDPLTGSTLTLGSGSERERGRGLALTAISPDGKRCRRFGIDAPVGGFLSVGAHGEIWFITNAAADGYKSSFGRLERPDLRW